MSVQWACNGATALWLLVIVAEFRNAGVLAMRVWLGGWKRFGGWRSGRPRVTGLVAAASAVALVVSLGLVTAVVTVTSPRRPAVPVQRWGSAAGRPHRLPAAADVGRIVDGLFVSGAFAAGSRVSGPVAATPRSRARVPGAVPSAAKPTPLRLPVRGKISAESARAVNPPAPEHKTGFDQKTSRELTPTGASQVVYANADGTKTAFEYPVPVNYRRPGGGGWAAIRSTLVPAGTAAAPASGAAAPVVSPDPYISRPVAAGTPALSPSMTPSATSRAGSVVAPALSPSPAAPAGSTSDGSPSPAASAAPANGWIEESEAEPESFAGYGNAVDLVTMPVDGSHQVSFGISGAEPAAGAASGSTVTYAGVRSNSSATFAAGTGLVKEDIVLSSAAAPSTWVFPLDLKGLRARIGPGGIVEFTDAAGKVLAYVPHGLMSDSGINPRSGDGATSTGVTYSVVMAGGRQAIRMTLDTAWLDSKDRVYPVRVDPSVSDASGDGTTYVQYPESGDFSGGTEIHAGTWDGGADKAVSYLAFGSVASSLKNDTVLGARLGVFNTWSYSCSPRPVYVYPVTSSWSVTGSKSWPGPSTGAAVGRASFATGWVPLGSAQSPCPASWEGFDLDQGGTNLINGWTHGTVADDGLAIGASDSDSYGWKKFASDSTSAGDPFLAVTYTTDGASYQLASKTPMTQVTPTAAGSFAVKVTNTGAGTWTAGGSYQMGSVAYNALGAQVSGSLAYTALPSSLAPGQSATVDVKVGALGAGYYRIVMGMYDGSQSFASQGVQDYEIGLYVPEPPPVVAAVYPPTGYTATTLQQQLSTSATYTGTVSYDFTLTCEPLAGQACADSSVTSGSTSNPHWTPPAADLDWDVPYQWKIAVTDTSNGQSATTTVGPVALEAEPPQPAITSTLGGSSGQAYDPLSGNYTTSATDAAVKSAGPPLEIDRTYNSMDPRTSGAFGAGWSSVADASLENDGPTVLVTLPDGQQLRFGQNGDGSYAAPSGSPDALVKAAAGTWTLRDPAGDRYAFSASGQLTSITDVNGDAQDFGYDSAGQLTTITDAVSGRLLTLTWSGTHVASVSTQAPSPGAGGYTWTYSYTGNELTGVCAPAWAGSGCTSYSYGSGSDYRASVLDADPRAYWQLGDAAGAAAGTDEVDANLGADNISYHSVTLGVAGPLAGSSETAASFNGTSSWAQLPDRLLSDDTDVAVGLWFKAAAGTKGVLFGYSAGSVSSGSAGDHAVPALYIGSNGDLYGEIYAGSSAGAPHSSVAVNNGQWHYAVLTASSSSQALYLDGALQGTLSGQVNPLDMVKDSVGAGWWGSGWPQAGTAGTAGYFNGDIAQVAVYQQPLSAAAVASQYALATAASPELTRVTLPSGNIYEQASYDAGTARLAAYTDPNGGQWTIGQPQATGIKTSSDALGAVTDSVTVTDPAGRQETYGYDITDGGRMISHGNGVDPPQVYGYDAAGFLTTEVDPDGNLACLTNDVHGNILTSTWYPAEPASLPSPGAGANPASCGGSTASSPSCTISRAPCTTFDSYYYNPANPLDPQNDELLTVRDGRSASAADITYETQYAYNTTGQLTSSAAPATSDFPSGRVTRYAYTTGTESAANGGTEPAGLLASQTTPGGAKTSYAYDANGDLARETEPSGRYTTYTYDAVGLAGDQHGLHLHVRGGGDDQLQLHARRAAVDRHPAGRAEPGHGRDPPAGGHLHLRRRQQPAVGGPDRCDRQRSGADHVLHLQRPRPGRVHDRAGRGDDRRLSPGRRGGQRDPGRGDRRV